MKTLKDKAEERIISGRSYREEYVKEFIEEIIEEIENLPQGKGITLGNKIFSNGQVAICDVIYSIKQKAGFY